MNREAVQEFMFRFMEMATGATVIGVVGVGDRTGLFREMAGQGPLTLEQIAERTGLQERYLREGLACLAAARVVTYDPQRETYELPEEAAACLADEGSPYFLGGWAQVIPAVLRVVPHVARAFREGGGVPYSEFGEEMVAGIDRSNSPGMRVLLTRKWLPAMAELVKRLEGGIRVADIGCGSGAASITMAKAYPRSTVLGYDIDPTSIARARAAAAAEGLDNVRFEQVGAESIPTEPAFDFIASFDVVHDTVNPHAVVRRVRQALQPDGTFLMVEPAAGDTLEQNLHPGGALLYGMSTLHCMTVSLAHGGEGLGTAWGPKAAETLCRDAGFTRFRRLEVDNLFNAFYEIRP
jgi:SAM-dependent methyltransferase